MYDKIIITYKRPSVNDMGKNIFKLISQSFVISHFRPSYAYYNNTFGGSDV